MKNKLFKLLPALFILLHNSILAQVPVFEEPRHKVVLLNDYIRLIDVHIPPHDTTLYHRHNTASAIVFLTKNTTGSQPMGRAPSIGQAIPGNTFFAGYGDKPISHRVWNQDTSVYHVMDIEILKHPDPNSCDAIQNPSLQLKWEEKPARMYSVHINQQDSIDIAPGKCGHLLVVISGSVNFTHYPSSSPLRQTTKKNPLHTADFIWFDPGMRITVSNAGKDPADCVLLEIR
ncbi:MAG TPA: hypothetical protein VMI12_08005 [Puia sp.]|nr:hypothetical protein [Puia sp.]